MIVRLEQQSSGTGFDLVRGQNGLIQMSQTDRQRQMALTSMSVFSKRLTWLLGQLAMPT